MARVDSKMKVCTRNEFGKWQPDFAVSCMLCYAEWSEMERSRWKERKKAMKYKKQNGKVGKAM